MNLGLVFLLVAGQTTDQGYIEQSERMGQKLLHATGISVAKPIGHTWTIERRNSERMGPVVTVKSEFYGRFFYLDRDSKPLLDSYSPGIQSTVPDPFNSQQEVWEKVIQYLRALEFNQEVRIRHYEVDDDTIFDQPEITIGLDILEKGVPLCNDYENFWFVLSKKTGQIVRLDITAPIKPDPDTRCLVTPVQARSVILQHLEGNWNQEVLEVVHRRAGNGGKGLGKWTPELERRWNERQGTLVWRGLFGRADGQKHQFFVDAKTGELSEVESFPEGGGFGATSNKAPTKFLWDVPKSKIAVVGSKSEKIIQNASIERVTAKVGVKRVPVTLRIEKAVVRAEFDPKSGLLVDPVSKVVGRPSENLRSHLPVK